MKVLSVGVVLFVVGCLAGPAFAGNDDQFRVAAGVGVPYGRYGVNGEYRFSSYASVGAGLGYLQNAVPGWAVGAMLYPLKNTNSFNPRLTGYFGKVGVVNWSDGRHEGYLGGALGGGFEWRIYKKLSMDLDLFYLAKDLPAGVNSSNNVGMSYGVGILF